MARDFIINGESLVRVKGPPGSAIASLSELGLAQGPISIALDFRFREINLDAYGGEIPVDVQFMLAAANISMTLIHYDPAILNECLRLSMGNAPAIGQMSRAGQRLGNNTPDLTAGNSLYVVNITSPVAGRPWRFPHCYMPAAPITYPLGTEKSLVQVNFRAIPYQQDPYGGSAGATGVVVWDYALET